MRITKTSRFRSRQYLLAGVCLIATAGVVFVRWREARRGPEDVVREAAAAWQSGDDSGLWSLMASDEQRALGIDRDRFLRSLDRFRSDVVGKETAFEPVEIEKNGEECADATLYFTTPQGDRRSVGFFAVMTDEGWKLRDGMGGALLSTWVSRAAAGGPTQLPAEEKIRRMAELADYGKKSLEPIGLKGIVITGKSGVPELKPWDEFGAEQRRKLQIIADERAAGLRR